MVTMENTRKKHVAYTCCRCGYATLHKPSMRKHLYTLKKPCPKSIADIEFTDEIKEYIMCNRVYHEKKKESAQKVINNFNTMNNFINFVDLQIKVNEIVKHKQAHTVAFDFSVDMKYEQTRLQLENDQGHHTMTESDFIDVIDDVTRVSDKKRIENYNILYDDKSNKIIVFDSGDWRELFVMSGLKTIISTIQDYYWNSYECYLIRKIVNKESDYMSKSQTRELLRDLYTFLASIDVKPFVFDKHDNMIIYTADKDEYWQEPFTNSDGYEIVEEYKKFYTNIQKYVNNKQKEKTIKQLLDILKRNSKNNVHELNKYIINMINMEDDFKQKFLMNSFQ